MSEPTFNTLLFQKLLDMLYTEKAISVPKEFHSRCAKIKSLLENDITGLINTLTSFSVNSAYNTTYRVECPEGFESLEEALNEWLGSLNSNIEGIPSGIQAISKEYYQERWQGSSLLLLRVKNWKETEVNKQKLILPQQAFYVNGASVWVKTPDPNNFKLGSFEYYLNKDEKPSSKVPLNKNENIIVQKPFSRWFSDYPTPYLVKNGVYKNYKSIELLQDKGDEVITKIIPYLFMIKRGSEALSLQLKSNFTDQELKDGQANLKDALETYKSEKSKLPAWMVNWDTEVEHLIPDLAKVLREDLYTQSYRAVLSGLGFVDVVQGIASSIDENEFVLVRKEGKISLQRVKNLLGKDSNLFVPTYEKGNCIWKKASVWNHDYKGKMYKLFTDDGSVVKVTGNHSVMVYDKEKGIIKKRADALTQKDILLELKNTKIINNEYQKVFYFDTLGSNQNKKVENKRDILVNEDFAHFLGWFSAEGYYMGQDGIQLAVGTKKTQAEEVLKLGETAFNKTGRLDEIIKKGYNNIVYTPRINGRGIAKLFIDICGRGAKNKKVPEVIFNSPLSVQKSYVEGLLFGDGHFSKLRNTWELTTASEELAYGFITLARNLGYHPHLNIRKRRIISKNLFEKRTYYLVYLSKWEGIPSSLLPNHKKQRDYVVNTEEIRETIEGLPKDWILRKILKTESYDFEGNVFDLEVKDNETFVAGCNILVHNTRKESVLNPKPFIAEINSGVEDFKSMIMEVVNLIVDQNKLDHRKLFSSDNKLRIVNTPLRINVETIEEIIRSAYDRGNISRQSYVESIGFDFDMERERRISEFKNGDEDTMYPQITQNTEKDDARNLPTKPRNDTTNKKENKNPNSPESKNFKGDLELEVAPYKNLSEVPPYIKKMEEDCQKVFMATFNSVYEDTKDEGKAFSISINAAKRCMGKKGYTYDKESKTWKKK